jgi:hypothetical protein
MAVNPTGIGYEFEWEEIVDDSKKNKVEMAQVCLLGLVRHPLTSRSLASRDSDSYSQSFPQTKTQTF